MEQNEMSEDNRFENFTDQEKYISIGDYYAKKADFYARIAQIFLVLVAVCIYVGGYIDKRLGKAQVGQSVVFIILVASFYLLSVCFAIIGYCIKKTSLSRLMLTSTILIPVYFFAFILVMMYIVGTLFGGFAPSETSFMDFVLCSFN